MPGPDLAYRYWPSVSAYAPARPCPEEGVQHRLSSRSATLSAYALATRCPVLTERMVLGIAMPGTDVAYAAVSAYARATRCPTPPPILCCAFAMRRPVLAYALLYGPTRWGVLRQRLCHTGPDLGCMALRFCYAVCGTDLGYAATRSLTATPHAAELLSTTLWYRPTRRYAMSGTDLAYGARCYGATSTAFKEVRVTWEQGPIPDHAGRPSSYAKSDTDIANTVSSYASILRQARD
eukprot:1430361-Rhodomonas_salina.4